MKTLFPKFPNYVAMENLHAFTWLFQILICNLLSLICIYIQFSFSGSGDHDMCVPFTGSEAWTRSLGYKVVDEWRPWTSNGQVAGYLLLHIFLHQIHNRNR